jgi:hypothetical protein
VGYIGRKRISQRTLFIGIISSVLFACSSLLFYFIAPDFFGDASTSLLFVGLSIACLLLSLVIIYVTPMWRNVNIGSIIGLGVGSLWIGLGVWAYSHFFIDSPVGNNLTAIAALGWFIWTYFTEIPFLILLVPPILKASYAAFSQYQPDFEQEI